MDFDDGTCLEDRHTGAGGRGAKLESSARDQFSGGAYTARADEGLVALHVDEGVIVGECFLSGHLGYAFGSHHAQSGLVITVSAPTLCRTSAISG